MIENLTHEVESEARRLYNEYHRYDPLIPYDQRNELLKDDYRRVACVRLNRLARYA